jgi:YesN/AraC family two-component response regulator
VEESGALCCIVLQINHTNPVIPPDQVRQERMRGRELVENHLQYSEEWIGYWDSESLILFFCSHSPVDWQLFSGRAELLRRDLSHAFRNAHPDLEVTAGMSSVRASGNPFRQKNEAEKACLYSYFRGVGRSIAYHHFQRSLEMESRDCETLFREFAALLNRREMDELKEGIDRFQLSPLRGNGGQRLEVQDLFRKYYYHLRSFCDQPVLESLDDMFLEFSSLEAGGAALARYNDWLRRMVVQLQAKMSMSLSLSHRVTRYLETRYQGDVSLSEVAEHLQVNPSYLSRVFSREAGKGFAQYLQELRIHKAQELMEESHLKIYEIAELVGFQSPESFSRAFKKVTGTSPRKYFH